jgi:hypothetical protein
MRLFFGTYRGPSHINHNFFPMSVFFLADSFFEFAQCCGLTPPLDPQAAGLSFEGRAVPDYGAPFNFLAL